MPTPDRVEVGRVVKAHGLRGEVSVHLLTDVDDRLAAGVRVLARSALLQGLLADPGRGLGQVPGLDDALRSFARATTTLDRDPLELALGWVRARPAVRSVVLGAEDAGQLRRLHTALLTPALDRQELSVLEAVEHETEAGTGLPVDPRYWGR
jgi:aryl-alcohol dehydrogenase-like predicted oxidoreductase